MGVLQCDDDDQSWRIRVEWKMLPTKGKRSLGLYVMPEDLSSRTLSVGDGPASTSIGSKNVEYTAN